MNIRDLKPPRRVLIVGGLIVIVGLVVIASNLYFSKMRSPGSSSMTKAPDSDQSTPEGEPSEQYGKLIRENNRRRIADAETTGESVVPTVGGDPNTGLGLDVGQVGGFPEPSYEDEDADPDVPENSPGAPPEPTPPENSPGEAVEQTTQLAGASNPASSARDEDEYSDAIRQELSRIQDSESVPQSTTVVFNPVEDQSRAKQPSGISSSDLPENSPEPIGQARTQSEAQQNAPAQRGRGNRATASSYGIRPGDQMYAAMDIKLNSDAPGPVAAEVIAGDNRGAKLLGSFDRQRESLVVKFSQFVPADRGAPVSIEAYAVSPETSSTAVASHVNNHTLSRWGGLIAARFAEGYGDALRRDGSTVATNIGTGGASAIIQNANQDAGKNALQALGSVGQAVGDQLEQNFDRPPTVTLAAGETIGVLVISSD